MEAFIRKNGVTKCPGMGTKELAELNLRREREWQAMTPEERWRAAHPVVRRGRSTVLSSEEKKERQREASRKWYAANREKRAAYYRERRQSRNQA